ncbi:MAG: Glycosyl transferase family 2 [Microgenomates group bacterium GW2011_GWF2_47_9]|nr:MAG: Glycosyl transferase family 2 [Microgenomates group bacterium GW2011_GWF2_47_9]
MRDQKLSVALAVYNEEDNLAACLETIKDIADEIVVVDGNSKDKTAEIAEHYHAKVIKVENKANFHINKQMAISACQYDWILQLDADERVTSMLAREIRQICDSPLDNAMSAYYLKRRNYFLGRWMNKGGMYPDPVIRLFQKGKAHLPQANVHELMTVNGSTGWLKEDLLHIADPTFARYLKRSNRYTTLQAEAWFKEGKIKLTAGTAFLYLFAKPLLRFLEIYVRHKGFMDKLPGLIFAYYSGLHIASSYVKYFEFKSTQKQPDILRDWE